MFDRFDICEAYYMFATLYHGGMSSPEYAIFTRLHHMGFQPRHDLSEETLTENGLEIYQCLVKRWTEKHSGANLIEF